MEESGRVVRQPDHSAMKRECYDVYIREKETRKTIREAYLEHRILLEPHGAVAWAGLMRYLQAWGDWSPCVSLETADPAKFPDEIIRATGINPPLPPAMARLDELEESFERIDGEYASLKALLRRFG